MRQPSSASDEEADGVQAVLEGIGFGRGQALTIMVGCGAFFAEGLELLLVTMLTPSVMKDIGAGHRVPPLISIILAGSFVGNLISGPFADRGGRQCPIISGYVFVVVFSAWSSFMDSVLTISVLRFFVGFGTGLGQPAGLALVREVMPRSFRFTGTAACLVYFGIGAALAVLLVIFDHSWLEDFTMKEWRLLLRCAAVPVGALGLLAILFLPESPSFLVAVGDYALARDFLAVLRKRNGLPQKTPDQLGTASAKKQLQLTFPCQSTFKELLCSSALPQGAVVGQTAVVLNFALYGTGYAVPLVLPEVLPVREASLAPTYVLLFATVVASLLLAWCPRWELSCSPKAGLTMCLAISVSSAVLFCWTTDTSQPSSFLGRLMLVPTCLGLCCGPAFGMLFLVQLADEVYSALSCATGVAVCMAVGRIGAVLAPLIFSLEEDTAGGWNYFFVTLALLELGCLLLVTAMPMSANPWDLDLEKKSTD